jgi:hypothetical protein
MGSFRRRWTGKSWMVYEERDGYLGWLSPASGGGWEWETDLRGFRLAQHFRGSAPTLVEAQEAFKATYERWRAGISDEQFDHAYRRSAPRAEG